MKSVNIKKFLPVIVPIITALIVLLSLNLLLPKAQPKLKFSADNTKQNYKETIHFVAVGDSLTEGVGDETGDGGYVPIVANELKEHYDLSTVQNENFGVAGERSDQILKRIKKDDDLQTSLASADLISITVGGNDLMQSFQKKINAKKSSAFNGAIKKYDNNIQDIMDEIRELNKEAPIYIVGIYNPYYLNFSNIKIMQEVVDNWNESTKEIIADNQNTFFIPVNDLLYKGYKTANSDSEDNSVKNNLLSDDDSFHPNNTGYHIMAEAISQEMVKSHNLWLLKENE
ncbi:SGNH/GDSL hydrolase family protein [Enterococcus alishanensis]|uniref:SGNH/GDSL hydrolase family protein n=1 Tax=Enterococcus alishanensis TaxID=1303817 RepID=A0ABS6TAW4_9ENTE|nr:SGNH/GDSL hydrolase family protein [Enterococcus alishanensis]MBV7390024.1 SGNH/GDSL hydrolase family protein [Enterococcus alishanensis]